MLIDSHCHLDFAEFDPDRDAVLKRAREAGVAQIVVPAVSRASWADVARLCGDVAGCHAAYGLHPYFLDQHAVEDIDVLADWLDHHDAVAVGEAGLDFAIDADRKLQQRYFTAQLELAESLDLPIILHAHRALEQVLQTLKTYPDVRFVVHAFSGSDQQLAQLLDLGGYIGVGGTVTYERAQRLRRQVSSMDFSRVLLETDAPDQPLCGYQGERNEPARVGEVARVVAELRALSRDEVAAQTSDNARRFFCPVADYSRIFSPIN
ncbi:TatD family hydrolase [Cardiobacteriaceae bacterium TAE3-ERU3]|nr:TatD family hydrolase [Cardiobacteriaceae bacterium TAE3-ERU3]